MPSAPLRTNPTVQLHRCLLKQLDEAPLKALQVTLKPFSTRVARDRNWRSSMPLTQRTPARGRISTSQVPPTWAVVCRPVPWQFSPRSMTRQLTSTDRPSLTQLGVLR